MRQAFAILWSIFGFLVMLELLPVGGMEDDARTILVSMFFGFSGLAVVLDGR